MSEESRENYRNFREMMLVMNGMRTTGLTNAEISEIAAGSKYKANNPGAKSSDRTARRIVKSILSWYGPRHCYKDKKGKWHLVATDVPEYLDLEELQALNIAIQKLDKNQDLVGPLTELNTKLTSRFESNVRHRTAGDKHAYVAETVSAEYKRNAIFAFIGPRAHIASNHQVRNLIEDAISMTKVISFQYTNSRGIAKAHIVHPVGIMIGPSNIYLVSYEVFADGSTSPEPIKYILENISDAQFTGERFKRYSNFNIEEYASQFFGIFSDTRVYDVEWRAAPNVADAVKRFTFHPTQTMIDNPDGSVTIRFHAGGLRAMATYLFQWAGDIVPIAPAELVEEYRLLLTKCLETIS